MRELVDQYMQWSEDGDGVTMQRPLGTFPEFLMMRREAIDAEHGGFTRIRGANWMKSDVLSYAWAVYCAARRRQAMTAVERFSQEMAVADPNMTEFLQLRRIVSEWEHESRI